MSTGAHRRQFARPVPAGTVVGSLSNGHTSPHLPPLVGIHATTLHIQAKPMIGAPDDAHEREADAVADAVMRASDDLHACPGCMNSAKDDDATLRRQTSSPFSIREGVVEEDEEGSVDAETVRTKPATGPRPIVSPSIAGRIAALRSGGQPLPNSVRDFMEPRFGHDFGRVRVHTGSMASATANSLRARAFTIGRDVVFGHGQFSPGSAEGRRLIAHELTHVVQQGHALPRARLSARAATATPPAAAATTHEADGAVIRRVAWWPNRPTGRSSRPWGSSGPVGRILRGETDAGTALDIWSPADGTTYWCHGYTFGGSSARGGPYSIWGSDVPTVLNDDGWKQTYSCMAQPADILVFRDDAGQVTHSGIIRSVSAPGGQVDDAASTVESKWGAGSHNTSSWARNAGSYGKYTCYSKAPLTGVCSGKGANES